MQPKPATNHWQRGIQIRTAALLLTAALLAACSTQLPPRTLTKSWPVFPNAAGIAADKALSVSGVPAMRNFFGTQVVWKKELAAMDGYSPLQPILLPLNKRCDGLPQPGQEAWSLADTSPVILYDQAAATRIPWFGRPGQEPTICEIFPLQAYADHSIVHVVLTNQLDGHLREGSKPDGVVPLPAGVNVPSASVVTHFSFSVGSRVNRVQYAYRLRDDALRWAKHRKLLTSINRHPARGPIGDRQPYLFWSGTFEVPWYSGSDGLITYDPDGVPRRRSVEAVQFYLIVPRSVTAESEVPLIVYGHGLFGDPREVLYNSQTPLRNKVAGIFGATTWGMSTRWFARAADALFNPEQLPVLQDIVLQSLINKVLFVRVMRDELGPLIAAETGLPVSSVVDYIGISQGGILGSLLAALSPDLRRVVLHVGGGNWTPMMTSSVNWGDSDRFGYGNLVAATVPDAVERTYLLALWQSIWDRIDPAIFSLFWFAAPPDLTRIAPPATRQVYYPYSIDDPQVPNFASETVMRTAGIPLLLPSFTTPPMINTVDYNTVNPKLVAEQWNVGGGEAAHSDVRMLPAFVEKVRRFIRRGTIEDTCGGKACRFKPF